jgi:hypothetical protein
LGPGKVAFSGKVLCRGPVAVLDDLVDDAEGRGVLEDREARADAEAVAQNMVFFLIIPSRL